MAEDLLAMFQSLESQGSVVRENVIRAPFGYPGGKSRSLEQILPHLPYRSGYGEAFGGSGAVLLARNGSALEVFNDRYSGVTCFYRVLRDQVKMNLLLDRLNMVLHSREEFLWCRDTWKNCEDEVERAARWWYMTVTSFGQQGRNFGRGVCGKAQIGPKIKTNLKFFPEVHSRMTAVQVENLDWRVCLIDFDSEDWVWYLDPPYFNYAGGMYEHEFNSEEHKELLERIFDLKGFVALSGYENPLYNSYPWDHVYSWMVNVSVLSQGFTESNHLEGHEETLKRGYAREVLYIKESK